MNFRLLGLSCKILSQISNEPSRQKWKNKWETMRQRDPTQTWGSMNAATVLTPGALIALQVVGGQCLKDVEGTRDLGCSWSYSSVWVWARQRRSGLLAGKRRGRWLWDFWGCSCHEQEWQEQCFSVALGFSNMALTRFQASPSPTVWFPCYSHQQRNFVPSLPVLAQVLDRNEHAWHLRSDHQRWDSS